MSAISRLSMNAYLSTAYRNLSCAAGALLISFVVSASFLHSTATAPAAHVPTTAARAASV